MVYTAIAYLALAGAAWLFLRLIQACFWLPSHMKRQNNVQRMLQDKVDSYEKYIQECEAKEDAGEAVNDNDDRPLEEKRKERRECLAMLNRELQRIREGGDPYDFDYLLNEEEKKLLDGNDTEESPETKDDSEELQSGTHGTEQSEENSAEPKKTK